MFDKITEGIRSVSGYNFIPYRVTSESNTEHLKTWSTDNQIDGYIALGQTTYKLVLSTESTLPLITGGMVSAPPGINGISLSADPEAFFRHLELLNPKVNRIYYIYSKRNNGWLTERARKISKKYNIDFIALEVNDIKEATLQYKIILKSIRSETDALWLPLDNVTPLNLLLPEILKKSWNQHITVFSNNLQHTRRGTLFSLYPDHYKQGRRIVSLLQRNLENNKLKPVLLPSVDLKIAFNIRTASHFDIHFSKEILDKFDQIYPANN
ncbi:MAG: hypothetical protein OQK72_04655 [Gammaproteobacteria bacterium]|nr:hypothetical protein [Gammaproteobacteria bacterium]MCW9005142.1 hypothetical protein [Gammaproteobacteria bacterium]MCW9056460.1 hypothetical protein [Gammaproteobacteria bacterium]